MAKVSWTRRSINDLKLIHEFISLDSKFYADRFINKIVSRVEQLIEFPESGRIIPEKEENDLRELIEGNYRIFYKTQRGNSRYDNGISPFLFVKIIYSKKRVYPIFFITSPNSISVGGTPCFAICHSLG